MFAGLLSDDARRLYEALVADAPASAVAPEEPETPALAELLRHALVFRTPTGRLRAVPPAAALRRLLVARQRDLADANRELADRYAELERLERELPRAGQIPGTTELELLSGSDDTAARLHELVTGARHDCRHLRTHQVGGDPHDWPARAPDAAVRFRTICTPEALAQPTGATTGHHRPGSHRLLPRLPVQLTVADRVALVGVESTNGGALLVRAPTLVDALLDYFDLLWRRAVPLDPPAPLPTGGPSAAQLQVLRLAAAGLKDEAIARSLGRSTRWVRRHIESLEERLGATNRLTLGVAAARNGLI
ncbi:helix-turn-helix transcriptional regulator [Micromonospora phytophila]|uniref:helix-turn-helix transcriptional regulator n=1 Tax=Micromonospora phytophila TaxID=709888 RepID=UPI00202F94F3|nr:helix-turn-helix transcriptional regulator [Micromonospora phytophila]MCM0675874.1 helix-turn-helix transcriptional regulator [Micromonospora phytophila]